MKRNTLLLAGLAAVYSQFTAAAELEQVTVTGQRLEETLPQQLAQYGTKVDTITAEQVQNGGYIDIAGAVRSIAPGLYIAPLSGPFDYVRISLQGSRTQDVLGLVDGVRINNRLYGSTPPLDTVVSSMATTRWWISQGVCIWMARIGARSICAWRTYSTRSMRPRSAQRSASPTAAITPIGSSDCREH